MTLELKEHALDEEELARWVAEHTRAPLGQATLPWSRLAAETIEGLTVSVHGVYRGAERLALAVVHRVERLDALSFVGGLPERLLRPLDRLGFSPLRFPVAWLEPPMTNRSGLLTRRDLDDAERRAVAELAVRALRERVVAPALCVKLDERCGPGPEWSMDGALAPLPFLENTWLALPRGDFDDWLKARRPRRRTEIRRDLRVFAEHGGTLERLAGRDSLQRFAPTMEALHREVLANARAAGGLPQPFEVGAAFFGGLASVPGASILVARLQGEPVGAMVLLEAGEALLLKHCGLDYARARTSRAYFSLFYESIRLSIARGATAVDLGATTYDFKRRLGAELLPTAYRVDFRHPAVRLLRPLLARAFAEASQPPGSPE